jgi:hypothetical protein
MAPQSPDRESGGAILSLAQERNEEPSRTAHARGAETWRRLLKGDSFRDADKMTVLRSDHSILHTHNGTFSSDSGEKRGS